MRLQDYDISEKYTARVLKTTRITPVTTDEVRDIVLEVERPDFRYEVGQSIGVLVPGPHAFGNPYHFRLYTVADLHTVKKNQNPRITICVKRVSYIDEYNGEQYQGVASNYLCDKAPEDTITITGPYGIAFDVPEEKDADILMFGLGTGIAPFRAFIKKLYKDKSDWEGKVRLFHGARTGMELLYMNQENDDLKHYYDKDTFAAFEALSPRPHWDDPVAFDYAIEERAEEVWDMLKAPHTNVYVAGQQRIMEVLDKAFSRLAGSEEKWQRRKAELAAGKRWHELIY